MKINKQYEIKRKALGYTAAEMASIAGVEEGIYTLFEKGEKIQEYDFIKIKDRVEEYIRSFPREKYLQTRIIEETLLMAVEDPSEHAKTIAHLQIHVAKLNMIYVTGEKRF